MDSWLSFVDQSYVLKMCYRKRPINYASRLTATNIQLLVMTEAKEGDAQVSHTPQAQTICFGEKTKRSGYMPMCVLHVKSNQVSAIKPLLREISCWVQVLARVFKLCVVNVTQLVTRLTQSPQWNH